jgi:hypothetical protein
MIRKKLQKGVRMIGLFTVSLLLALMVLSPVNAEETTLTLEVWPSLTLDKVTIKSWPEKRVTLPGGNLLVKTRVQFRDPNDNSLELQTIATSVKLTGLLRSFDISSLDPGYFDIFVKGDSHLQQKLTNFYLTPTVTQLDFTSDESVYMKAGDINGLVFGDGIVNAIDLSILIENLDAFSLRSDLNRDNIVNALDLSALIVNLDDTDET